MSQWHIHYTTNYLSFKRSFQMSFYGQRKPFHSFIRAFIQQTLNKNLGNIQVAVESTVKSKVLALMALSFLNDEKIYNKQTYTNNGE